MNCDEIQRRLSESFDLGPAAVADPAVDRHLAGCAACREFHAVSSALEARLVRSESAAALPAGFKAALLARLPAPRTRLSAAEAAALRAQLDGEYREARAALRRRLSPRIAGLRSGFLWAGAAELSGLLAPWRLLAGAELVAASVVLGLRRAWRVPQLWLTRLPRLG